MLNVVPDAHDRFVSFQVVHFCDNQTHNKGAPNDQNRLCNLQSSWDVILKSSDFTKGRGPVDFLQSMYIPRFPVFQQRSTKRTVLVLDTSGSMEGVSCYLPVFFQSYTLQEYLPEETFGVREIPAL